MRVIRGRVAWTSIAALAIAVVGFARADEGGSKPPAPPAPGRPAAPSAADSFPWIDGFAAGRAAGKAKDQFLLVYVCQRKPPSEMCEKLERKVFADPRAPDIASRFTPVRLLAGDELTPDVKDFLRRYDVAAYPCLFVMNADGHLIVRTMDMTVDSVLRAVDFAKEDAKEYAQWLAVKEPAGRKKLREILENRCAWEPVIALLKAEIEREATPELLTKLADAHRHAGQPAEERAALTRAVETFVEAGERTRWRIRLATQELDVLDNDPDNFAACVIDRLEPLAAALAKENERAGEADVRLLLGDYHARLHRCDEARREFNASIALAPTARSAPKALLGMAGCSWWELDYETCKSICERVVQDFPRSEEARAARRTIRSCDEEMAKK